MDEAFRLGALLASLLTAVRRGESYQEARALLAEERFSDPQLERRLERLTRRLYAQAAVLGYTVQGTILGGVTRIPPSVITAAGERAGEQARIVRGSLRRLRSGVLTGPVMLRWLEAVLDMNGKRGMDDGQREAARERGANWKTWVRIGPVADMREHSFLSGTTIPMDALFTLPSGARVYGPRDWERAPDPAEWVNCQHGLIYASEARARDLERALTPQPFSPARIRGGLIHGRK